MTWRCQGDVRIDVASVNGELAGYESRAPPIPSRAGRSSAASTRRSPIAPGSSPPKRRSRRRSARLVGVIRIVQTPDQLGLRVIRPAHAIRNLMRIRSRACCGGRSHPALDELGLARGVRSKRRAEAGAGSRSPRRGSSPCRRARRAQSSSDRMRTSSRNAETKPFG